MHKRKRATTVKVARAFISLCQLEYIPDSPDDKRYEKYQLSLVAILTTLCTTARNDFLIFDSKLQSIVLWKNGMELMRNCYCNRAIPVDRAQLLTLRDAFFARYRWFYDESRCISRNHQNPGNYDDQYRKANHLEESKKWQLIIGNVDYSAAAVTSTAAGTPALTEADISKKARKDKAFKDRQANSYNAIDTAKKLKIPKPSAVPTPPPPASASAYLQSSTAKPELAEGSQILQGQDDSCPIYSSGVSCIWFFTYYSYSEELYFRRCASGDS